MHTEQTKLNKEQVDFIIKELDSLSKHRQEMTELQEKRLTSYSTIIGFGLSFIAFILGNNNIESKNININSDIEFPYLLPIFLFVVGVTIICAGLITYTRVIYRQIQVDKYKVKINKYKEILFEYFQLKSNEDLMSKLNYDDIDLNELRKSILSISSIIALLNTLFITVYFCSFLRFTIFRCTQDRILLIPIAILIYIAFIILHIKWRYKIERKHKTE